MILIYLDNNATTRLDDRVLESMLPFFTEKYGNPNSVHRMGYEAEKAIENARETIAKILKVDPREIYFTSCATESINWILKSTAKVLKRSGRKIITTTVEHKAVLNSLKALEKEGFKIVYIPVDRKGKIILEKLEKALDDEVILVSIIAANNELGTVQPIEKIVEIVKSKTNALVHVDAVQTVGKMRFDFSKWNVDLASFSAHKFHGPKGVGFAYIKLGVPIIPLLDGGGQERGMRSGTQNVPGIVGLGKAFQLAWEELETSIEKMERLRRMIAEKIQKLGGVVITPLDESISNTLLVSFPGIIGSVLANALSSENIFVSTGSACSSREGIASHVLKALNIDPLIAEGAIRISLSKMNTEDEIKRFLEKLEEIVKYLKL
ncbi:MAG TPA: cysteine desulfurase [Thermotoga sp.]|nr:cysteine desulfurase [Thermotoga sp.]